MREAAGTVIGQVDLGSLDDLAARLEAHAAELCPNPHPIFAARGQKGHWYRGHDQHICGPLCGPEHEGTTEKCSGCGAERPQPRPVPKVS